MTSTATLNPVLTGLVQNYLQDPNGFVAPYLAPSFHTSEQSAAFYVFDNTNILTIPRGLARAPSTQYKRTSLKLSDSSFSCTDKGIEIPVDDAERAKYASAFGIDNAAARRAANIVRVNQEIRVRDLATSAAVTFANPNPKWSAANSFPIADVDVAKEFIRKNCGLSPNLMVMPMPVFNCLKEHSTIMDRIKYSQRGVITAEILQEVFGVPRIIIAGLTENSAADGQAVIPDDIWGDNVILCHSENTEDLQAPNFLRTFIWTAKTGNQDVMVETYREQSIRSDIHAASQFTDEKLTGAGLGYNIADCL